MDVEERSLRRSLLDAAGTDAVHVLRDLRSGPQGLSSGEADTRLRRDGPNLSPQPRGPGLPFQFARQLTHLFALMLWCAAVLAFLGKLPELAWAIIVVVLINGTFSFVQEFRAERAARALRALLPERSSVVRDGRRRIVPAEELVRGDLLSLQEGDRISADARVIDAHGLKVDNATLTGESEPVPRSVTPTGEALQDPLDADNVVFAGTHVASGSGTAVVVTTGAHTRLGGISSLTEGVVRRPTPLRLQLDRMIRLVGILAVAAGGAFFMISLAMGMSAGEAFLFGVGVLVALIPEGLLPTFTLSLAMGAKRMAGRGALVRSLEAVETLGSTTVICTDKTGTMTANQMTVQAVALPGWRFDVSGSGYDPRGAILADGRPLSDAEMAAARPLLRASALCGEARLRREDGTWRCLGDPTEGALLVLATKGGVNREEEERRAPRVREFPFESARERMSTVHILPDGTHEILTKGAPEVLVPLCKSILVEGGSGPLDESSERDIRAAVDSLAIRGLRVLAFARRGLGEASPKRAHEAEADMQFLGLVGMADPVRPEVPEAVARCRRAGIRVVMVTGDHPATAMSVGRQAGLPTESVVIGSELPADDGALAELLRTHVAVLARIAPEQKLRIARVLQEAGEVVAMTGDGVNDAPALRRADIGVAMGKGGTDVAREASDLVLLDDNFAHIVEAVEEGRAAFDNMKRFLTYVLTSNVPELAPFLVWALSTGSVPLTLGILQILAVDLGTDLLPALALGAERPTPDAMRRPPRSPAARLLDRGVIARAYGFLGPLQAVASLAMIPIGSALVFGWQPGMPLPHTPAEVAVLSTMVWASIVTLQVANSLECRSTRASILRPGIPVNRMLLWAIISEIVFMVAFVYTPGIRQVLGHVPLTPVQWIPVALAPILLIAGEEARKAVIRRRTRSA